MERIAIVAESFLPNVNGVSNSVLRILEHFNRTGIESIVIAPDQPKVKGEYVVPDEEIATEVMGVPVYRVPSKMVPKISSLPVGFPLMGLVDVLRDFDPDVVHLASPFLMGGGGLGAARRLGVPTVAVFQTDVAGFAQSYGLSFASRAAWAWTRQIHKLADRTLAPSSAAVADLAAHHIPRVHIWGRGVDIERFAPSRRQSSLREQWLSGIGRGDLSAPDNPHCRKTIVGFVGRVAPEKHVERMAALSGRDDVQLVIVGGGPDLDKLKRLMPDAIFTGQLGGVELAEAYASLDIFVHTGEYETFCQAVQEALASGVPAIGPRMGGPIDLISHGRTGYLLDVSNFERELVQTVDSLLDPAKRAVFALAARKSVIKRTWPAICDELLEHYDEVQFGTGEQQRRPRLIG